MFYAHFRRSWYDRRATGGLCLLSMPTLGGLGKIEGPLEASVGLYMPTLGGPGKGRRTQEVSIRVLMPTLGGPDMIEGPLEACLCV